MAHSDALIFLTNITWIFFLFLFLYFGFVLYFLPTLYKKFRARVLVKRANYFGGLLSVCGLLTSLAFFCEMVCGLSSALLSFLRDCPARLKTSPLYRRSQMYLRVFTVITWWPFFSYAIARSISNYKMFIWGECCALNQNKPVTIFTAEREKGLALIYSVLTLKFTLQAECNLADIKVMLKFFNSNEKKKS